MHVVIQLIFIIQILLLYILSLFHVFNFEIEMGNCIMMCIGSWNLIVMQGLYGMWRSNVGFKSYTGFRDRRLEMGREGSEFRKWNYGLRGYARKPLYSSTDCIGQAELASGRNPLERIGSRSSRVTLKEIPARVDRRLLERAWPVCSELFWPISGWWIITPSPGNLS